MKMGMRWVIERQRDVKSLESEVVVGVVNAKQGCADRQQNGESALFLAVLSD